MNVMSQTGRALTAFCRLGAREWSAVCLAMICCGETRAAEGAGAQIVIHAEAGGREIHPELFGANICWPRHTNNLNPETGRPKDFLALAPLGKQLGLKILRYPGGLWSDAYRWKHGIGPVTERRAITLNGHGKGLIPIVGTDEFLRFCEAAEMRGIITVNYGLSKTETADIAVQEAADWVEYCNAPNDGSNPGGGTDWAQIRARNGHPAPYGVPYWEIGNEIYILDNPEKRRWGHTDVTTYAKRCVEFSQAMKRVDPTIKVGAVAHMAAGFVSANDARIGSDKPWTRTILEIAGQTIDFLIPHVYSGGVAAKQALLPNNGEVGGHYMAQTPGKHRIEAIVGGSFFRDEWSRFQLQVNGTVIRTIDTSSKHGKPFVETVHLEAGKHTVTVRFINDLWVKGEGDRNLSVAGLSVTGPDEKTTAIRLVTPQDRVSLSTAVIEADRKKLQSLRALIREVCPDRADTLELAVTEWNESTMAAGDLGSALHAACKLMMMAEEGVESAHYWLLFNATAYRRTELWFPAGDVRLPRPSAFVFQIFSQHCGTRIRPCDVSAPPLPALEKKRTGYPPLGPALRILPTVSEDAKTLHIIVVNRNVKTAMETHISWPGFTAHGNAKVTVLTGPDSADGNTGCTRLENLRVRSATRDLSVQVDGVTHTFLPMSVTGISITSP